jgi:predicted permease
MEIASLMRRGLSRADAEREAEIRFGGRTQWSESARDELRSRILEEAGRDLRYAVKGLGRQPGFTIAAAATIGLTLTAVLVAFRLAEMVFLAPLDVPRPDRLVRVTLERLRGERDRIGLAEFALLRTIQSFESAAAHYSTAPLYVEANGQARELQGAVVTWTYFPLLGARPARGRFFTAAEDDIPGRDAVAVISHALWRDGFGGAAVLGTPITINRRIFTIVGVAAEGFHGVEPELARNEIWIPMGMVRTGYRWCDPLGPDCTITAMLARLAPGATPSSARSEASGLLGRLAALGAADDTLRGVAVTPVRGWRPDLQDTLAPMTALLAAIAVVLLLIGCTNLAGLLIARGTARRRELALRRALGASQGRLIRQMLAESTLLAIMGTALAMLVSGPALAGLIGFFGSDGQGYTRAFDLSVRPAVPVMAFLSTVVALALFGLLPAIRLARVDPAGPLAGGRSDCPGIPRLRRALVGIQVGLSLGLLVGALLLGRSAARIAAPAGFETESVALLRVRPRLVGYGPDRAVPYLRRVEREITLLAGVESAALVGIGATWGGGSDRAVRRADAPVPSPGQETVAAVQEVSPGFLAALRVRLLRGRSFTLGDSTGTPPVMIVSRSLERALWPGGEALDQRLVIDDIEFSVVGVVDDYLLHPVGQAPSPLALIPLWQQVFAPPIDARLAVRTRSDPAAALPSLRDAITRIDPAVPVTETVTLRAQVAANFTPVRIGRTVAGLAAGLGLLLSSVGLYGVVAFLVAQQTREIGVRLAVGARPTTITAQFVRQGLAPVWWGTLAGLGAALATTRLLSTLLIGVSPVDPATYALAMLVTTAIAFLAILLPARRASRVAPVEALRSE